MSRILRKRQDVEKMRQIVAGPEGSGITQRKDCQQHDVPLSAFLYWRKKFSGSHPQGAAGLCDRRPALPTFQVEVTYPDSVCVSSRQGFEVAPF